MHLPTPALTQGYLRLIFLAAALGLLTMPVEYRGGSEEAHPHAAVQFWSEAGRGSLDHHHRDGSHHRAVDNAQQPTTNEIAYHANGDVDYPRLSEAAAVQKYTPIAIATGGALFTLISGGYASSPRIPTVRLTGIDPTPALPPPRLPLHA